MSWRKETLTISRGGLVGLVIAGALIVAAVALVIAVILTAAFTKPPLILIVAFCLF